MPNKNRTPNNQHFAQSTHPLIDLLEEMEVDDLVKTTLVSNTVQFHSQVRNQGRLDGMKFKSFEYEAVVYVVRVR